MFAPGTHGETVAIAGDHRRRGAIAEQGGGDDIALRAIHAAEGQSAEFHDEEQPAFRWRRASERRRAGQPQTATGAAPPAARRPEARRAGAEGGLPGGYGG